MPHRLLVLLPSLWPAVLVWLLIVFPSLAFSLGRQPGMLEVLPFPLSMFKLCRGVWPYTKCYRLGVVWQLTDAQRRAVLACPVCHRIPPSALVLDHALQHLLGDEMAAWEQGERAWWTPPAFANSEEADAWFDTRTRGSGYVLVRNRGLVYATDIYGRLLDGST